MNANLEENVEEYIEPMKSRMKDKWQDVQQRVSDKARYATHATHHYVKENPWRTVAMVALASCLFGWFLRKATSED